MRRSHGGPIKKKKEMIVCDNRWIDNEQKGSESNVVLVLPQVSDLTSSLSLQSFQTR